MKVNYLACAALAVATLALGCNRLGAVTRLQLTSEPLALGCYAQARIVDASLTSTASHAGVTSAKISNPSVAQLVAVADLPAGFPMGRTADRVYLKALAPGAATVSVDADFDDGTKRSASANVGVRTVDSLSIQPVCDQNVTLPLRVPAGTTVAFDAVPMSGGQKLAGYCPTAISGTEVNCSPYVMDIVTDTIRCQWQAPAAGGSVDLSSNLGPASSAQIATYGPADVTSVTALTSSGTRTIAAAGQGGGTFTAYVSLAGGTPCRSTAIQVKALTPAVCTGPAGVTTWTTTDEPRTVSYTSLAEGRCQLGLGAAGATTYPSTAEFSTRVATDFTVAHTGDPNTYCSTASATACLASLLGVVTCRGGSWSQPSLCGADQACEVLPSGSNGCTADSGCARCR
jgi:hypothetical protein